MKGILSVPALLFCIALNALGQGTVEAELDTAFHYQFASLRGKHQKKILVNEAHNTIYSEPVGRETAREMLRIMKEDGFKVEFTKRALDSTYLKTSKPDMLVLHGMPNNAIKLGKGEEKAVMYKSPLSDNEVIAITKYVYKGGSLFLFLSHFPGGSGALPLLEAFSVKFRDGYAYHPNSPGHNCGYAAILS